MNDQFTYCASCGSRNDQQHYRGCTASGPVAKLQEWKPSDALPVNVYNGLESLRDAVVDALADHEPVVAVIEEIPNVTTSSWREQFGLE